MGGKLFVYLLSVLFLNLGLLKEIIFCVRVWLEYNVSICKFFVVGLGCFFKSIG